MTEELTVAGLTIAFETTPRQEMIDPIHDALILYNRRALGDERYEPLRWIVRDADGQIAGGLLGELYFNWLYISILWVREDQRGKGVGSRLMALAEEYAIRQGRTHAHVDTLDFQAPDFYPRLGYTLFGQLGPYCNSQTGDGHTRYYFHKTLPSLSAEPSAP